MYTTALVLSLAACSGTRHPYESDQPTNEVAVTFTIESGSGTPVDLSYLYKEMYGNALSLSETRRMPPELSSITLESGSDLRVHLPERGPHTWFQLVGKQGKRMVTFPSIVEMPQRYYEIENPTREVRFIDGAVDRLTVTALPYARMEVKSVGEPAGYFVLHREQNDISLEKDGAIKFKPEDVGNYELSWVVDELPSFSYRMMCSDIVRDASVSVGMTDTALCSDTNGFLRDDCACTDNARQQLHVTVENGVIVRTISAKAVQPPVPPENAIVTINGAVVKVGDPIRVWYGTDLHILVNFVYDDSALFTSSP